MDEEQKYLVALNSSTILKLYVQPGSSKNEWVGLYGEPPRLKLKILSRPQDGEANAEVITFLAKFFKISKSKIVIRKGHISRQKDLLIEMDVKTIESFLNTVLTQVSKN